MNESIDSTRSSIEAGTNVQDLSNNHNNSQQITTADEEQPEERQQQQQQPIGAYQFRDDQSLWTKFSLPIVGEIRFNPIVSISAILLIWGFVIWCILEGEDTPFNDWRKWIIDNFTWLYIGSQDVWALFAIVLYFSKYSKLKLGRDDEEPEYNDVTWFMMLFACGIGTGLFFFGVSEPIAHYTTPNRYNADPTKPDNELAQIAINLTFYHWGIHGWIVYSLVGMLLALMAYREGLPMTMKSCFYPLIGDKIFGWMGDFIDIVSIMTTLFGVCTSLGLGTRQLNTGLHIILPETFDDNDTRVQIVIIWCITAVATISTVTGVALGIRRLSEFCFIFGMFIMMVSFFMDDTFYILNLFVQSIGYYIQWIIQLGFHCDTFESLNSASESMSQDRNRFIPEGFTTTDGPKDWMDGWTMFYWGWWISWCPFVGMFIAKISRGRTIRDFINGTLTTPIIYSFMWMAIFGGAGIRQERLSAEKGYCCPDEQGWFINTTEIQKQMIENSLNKTLLSTTNANWMCSGANSFEDCGNCAKVILENRIESNLTFSQFVDEKMLLMNDFGSVSADRKWARLSCHVTEQMWFDLMRSYGDMGYFLAVFSLFGIVLYFVTSSDSGSLVIDCLTANGDPEPPRIQRVFWALMEGATATALLATGGKENLRALQTAGLVSGLPYTFIVCLLCTSMWRYVKVAAGDMDPFGPSFDIGLFDPFLTLPFKCYNREDFGKTAYLFLEFIFQIILAPFTIAQCAAKVYNSNRIWAYAIPTISFFVLFFLFHILQLAFDGAWSIAWFWYLCFVTVITAVRIKTRELKNIVGNPVEDFFAALIFYPNTTLQIQHTLFKQGFFQRNLQVTSKRNGPQGASNGIASGEDCGRGTPLGSISNPNISAQTDGESNAGFEEF